MENLELGIACDVCWQNTRLFTKEDPLCEKCGGLLTSRAFQQCRQCDDQHFDFVMSVGTYEAALSKSVIDLKKNDRIPPKLTELIRSRLADLTGQNIEIVIPIPLSAKRRLERTFNQAESIGRLVSDILSKPMDQYSLVRTGHSPMHRAAMDRKAREMSVKGSFSVTRPNLIKGRNILLVDDVLTSGSTASHCARALKKAGAVEVNVFTIARALVFR